MDELTKVAVESFKQNNYFETSDYLELLTHKGYTLKDVIIVCEKNRGMCEKIISTGKIKFKWNPQTIRFERLNLKNDFMKYVKREKCLQCKNMCARNEIPFCDFLDLCKKGVFELVQILLS